jgi:general secretion pathway protein G
VNTAGYFPLRGRWLGYFLCGSVGALLLGGQFFRPPLLMPSNYAPRGAVLTQMNCFRSALALYRNDFGRFPSTTEGLDALLKNRAGAPYLTDVTIIPNDPWGTPYRYEAIDPAGKHHRITSLGGDSRLGGMEWDADITASDRSPAR